MSTAFETAFAVAEAVVAEERSGSPVGGVPAPRSAEQSFPDLAADPPAAAVGETVQVHAPELRDLGTGVPPGPARDLRLLAEVEVQLAVELGRLRLSLRELLSLTPGSVVELDRPADAPVDVLVNGTVVASGEVVVIDGEFGVRIT